MEIRSIHIGNLDIPFDLDTALTSLGITIAIGAIAISAFACLQRIYQYLQANQEINFYYVAETANNLHHEEFSTIDLNETKS